MPHIDSAAARPLGHHPDHSLTDLINGGDWACSFGDCDGLEQVYRELAESLDGALARRAEDLADSVDVEPSRAFEGWAQLVADLRAARLRH